MRKTVEVRYLFDCFRFGHAAVTQYCFAGKKDPFAFYAVNDGRACASQKLLDVEDFVDFVSFVLLEFRVLTSSRPVLLFHEIHRPEAFAFKDLVVLVVAIAQRSQSVIVNVRGQLGESCLKGRAGAAFGKLASSQGSSAV